MTRDLRIVDDRVLLLGLDSMYRARMKVHESGELLNCAERVAARLKIRRKQGPIEGYYTETAALTRYFQLMRALQDVSDELLPRAKPLAEFERLLQVATSPIFGTPLFDGALLPRASDPLYRALASLLPDQWNVPGITRLAHEETLAGDDCSLVGLAALIEDPVVLAAVRESVVLYAAVFLGAADLPSTPEYVWNVCDSLASRVTLFVRTFNELFDDELPNPDPDQAELFWETHDRHQIFGRCVRLGIDDSQRPPQHYHWAIGIGSEGGMVVEDFWDTELWTTQRYREERGGLP